MAFCIATTLSGCVRTGLPNRTLYDRQVTVMAEKKILPTEILLHISQSLNLHVRGLTAVIELLDDGGTVPFIARYRKEATGNLDEVQILSLIHI